MSHKLSSPLSFETEPDHLMPLGPAVIGHPYQPVLQSAAAAASSLRHVAVPRGDAFTSFHPSSEEIDFLR